MDCAGQISMGTERTSAEPQNRHLIPLVKCKVGPMIYPCWNDCWITPRKAHASLSSTRSSSSKVEAGQAVEGLGYLFVSVHTSMITMMNGTGRH